MDDTHEAILSHKCDVKPLCINGRRAVCSELRVVRVRVRDGVLVIHRSVLKRDVVMREGVRNAVATIVHRKCSLRFCHYSIWTISSAMRQPDEVRTSTFHQNGNHSCSYRTSILEDAIFYRMSYCKFL